MSEINQSVIVFSRLPGVNNYLIPVDSIFTLTFAYNRFFMIRYYKI